MRRAGCRLIAALNLLAKQTCLLLAIGGAFVGSTAQGEPIIGDNHIPDHYQEPGRNPNRDYTFGPDGTENIDPFSGILSLRYEDINLPGDGGMTLSVIRNYTASQSAPGYLGSSILDGRTSTGLGWTIHFGRVMAIDGLEGGVGGCKTLNEFANRQPVFESPDGSRQVLLDTTNGESYDFITKQYWKAECLAGGGVVVTSPQGMRYVADVWGRYRGNFGGNGVNGSQDINETHAYHVSRIEDPNGNSIDVTYLPMTGRQYLLIDQVTTSDGRSLQFTYADDTTAHVGTRSEPIWVVDMCNVRTDHEKSCEHPYRPHKGSVRRGRSLGWQFEV